MQKPGHPHTHWLISHKLKYLFEEERIGATISSLLRPISAENQRLHNHDLRCDQQIDAIRPETDPWGNQRQCWEIRSRFQHLTLTARTTLELLPHDEKDAPGASPPALCAEMAPSLRENSSLIWAWSSRYLPDTDVAPGAIEALMKGIKRDFAYDPAATAIGKPLEDIFLQCRGACQDFARLACAVLQARGTPTRYVIGYPLPQTRAGHVELHAWFDAWLPDIGWRSYDSVLPEAQRIILARAPRQEDIPVISGSCEGVACRQILASEIALRALPSGDMPEEIG